METPPPPPPPPPGAGDSSPARAARRPGQLTAYWRLTTLITWALVFVAWSGVWKASRELGLSTWWLGPVGSPRPFLVTIVPFLGPGLIGLLAVNNSRRLPWAGIAASVIGAVIGIVDLSYVRRLGVVELVIAGAAAAVSISSFSGMYRAAEPERATRDAPPADVTREAAAAPCGTNSPAG